MTLPSVPKAVSTAPESVSPTTAKSASVRSAPWLGVVAKTA